MVGWAVFKFKVAGNAFCLQDLAKTTEITRCSLLQLGRLTPQFMIIVNELKSKLKSPCKVHVFNIKVLLKAKLYYSQAKYNIL